MTESLLGTRDRRSFSSSKFLSPIFGAKAPKMPFAGFKNIVCESGGGSVEIREPRESIESSSVSAEGEKEHWRRHSIEYTERTALGRA